MTIVLCGRPVKEGLAWCIKNAPSDLYNVSKKDLAANDDVLCGQNEAYNIRKDRDVTKG